MNEEPKIYYNSHGNASRWKGIRELEVDERQNYTDEEFDEIETKYGVTPDDMAIWVTDNIRIALAYSAWADSYDEIMSCTDEELQIWIEQEGQPYKYYGADGVLIPEMDDGDHGVILIIRDTSALCRGDEDE